jgi:predicted transcriptional regulator
VLAEPLRAYLRKPVIVENVSGAADLRALFGKLKFPPDKLSRQLRRLRDLSIVKRVAGTDRYYLARIGRAAIAAACHLTQNTIIPALA